jgi:5-methyltetrahydropteroyltriglutamate--homocysteine methyltransferase
MAERSKPPFRADHVGSLIRPQPLIEARERAEKRELADAELKRIQHAAIREVVRMQEDLGLKLVTDGEFNRSSWHRDFMLKFANVRMIRPSFRSGSIPPTAIACTARRPCR